MHATTLVQYMAASYLFQLHREKRSLHVGLSGNGSILKVGPSETFLIVDHLKEDHNEQELKPYIAGGILDLLEKSSETREAST